MNSPFELHFKIQRVTPEQVERVVNHLKELTLFGDADYIVPADIQAYLEPVSQWYPDDESLQAVLDEIWRKVKNMHITTGKAVSWIALQEAMIRELEAQNEDLVPMILADQANMLTDALEACGCGFEEAGIFLNVFCNDPSELLESAKALIRQAVQLVYDVEMELSEPIFWRRMTARLG